MDLKIAVVNGDNLYPIREQLLKSEPLEIMEIGTGEPLPKTVHSMTAYYGAGVTTCLQTGPFVNDVTKV